MKIILASASPSRRRLLNSVGINPEIIVSGVDEELPEYQGLTPAELVLALAIVKAHTVKAMINEAAIVIGCDSTFEFNGRSLGKPETPANAIARCKELRGNSGILHTGHCFIDTAKGMEISDITSTKVFFADMTDREIEDYVATGEPLQVAGGFTHEGKSAAFITRMSGDSPAVGGISLALLREFAKDMSIEWTQLWD